VKGKSMNLGQRIKQKRQALGTTQEGLANALGMTAQHISAIEQDKRTPSLGFLVNLADELGVTIDYLLTGKEGVVPDIVTAIKADNTLKLHFKKALITMVNGLRIASSVPD
jgi:transcriptional regulator with XRE-family HTH domain